MQDNNSLKIARVTFKGMLNWHILSARALYARPFLYLGLSLFWLAVLVVAFLCGSHFQDYFWVASSMAVGISLVFPFTLASIAAAYKLDGAAVSTKLCASLWRGYSLRLIVVYVMLLLAVSLAVSYLQANWPEHWLAIKYTSEVIYLLLQLSILIALPANILLDGQIKPYHALSYALQAVVCNVLPIILFLAGMLVVLLLAIVSAQLLGHVLGKVAVVVYVIELWLLVTWISLSATIMAKQLLTRA